MFRDSVLKQIQVSKIDSSRSCVQVTNLLISGFPSKFLSEVCTRWECGVVCEYYTSGSIGVFVLQCTMVPLLTRMLLQSKSSRQYLQEDNMLLQILPVASENPPLATTGTNYLPIATTRISSRKLLQEHVFSLQLLQEHIMLKMAKLEFENHKTYISLGCFTRTR